jgi:acyl-CoA hydrolase
MEKRPVALSRVHMTELVLPNDTNQLGKLLGGRLMHWIDIAAAISAQRHSGRVCVTASVDEINFHLPISLGDVVTLQSAVTRAFRTSMEVGVLVTSQNIFRNDVEHTNNAYLTFVAVDETGRPVPVPEVIPETPEERLRYDEALGRRQSRLDRRQH